MNALWVLSFLPHAHDIFLGCSFALFVDNGNGCGVVTKLSSSPYHHIIYRQRAAWSIENLVDLGLLLLAVGDFSPFLSLDQCSFGSAAITLHFIWRPFYLHFLIFNGLSVSTLIFLSPPTFVFTFITC